MLLGANVALAVLAIASSGLLDAQAKLTLLQHHVRPEVTTGKARPAGGMPADQPMSVSIVLPLRNEAALDQLLVQLYDPSSASYRQFLSVAQFTEKFGPTPQDYAAVVAFARSNGLEVTATPANRLVVPVRGTVDAINRAFQVQMSLYQHPTENRLFYSPDREPSLALSVPVAHVAGLNNFSVPKPLVKRAAQAQAVADYAGSGPGGKYLASDMRAAYYGGTQLTGAGQAVGLLEFGGYYLKDVNLAFSTVGQSYSVPINNVLIDGAVAEPVQGGDDAEQVLDIAQAIGMAPGLSQVRVYIGNSTDDANVLNAMATENIAKVLSCSWSWVPESPGTDDLFLKEFAAQGQTFVAASGDMGAYDATVYTAFYPQEAQYVTATGATHLTTMGAGGAWASETAWDVSPFGSGGGVSPDGIAIPGWQAGVATTFNNASKTLRNVPDVAMEGDFDNYNCDLGVCSGGWGGTSLSAPRWAGFVALVNQQAAEAGTAPMGSVGFLNPALYAIGQSANYSSDFHDIVVGNNGTDSQSVWYNAVTGYDLVTGWGSPAGPDLINDLAGKQLPGFWLSASSQTVAMNPGASGTTTINVVDAGGFSGNVQLSVTSGLPSGVTAKWGTNPTSGGSVLTLSAASTVANTTTTITIAGKSGSVVETTKLTLTVHAPSFSLYTMPGSLGVGTGYSGTATVVVTPLYGFTGSVRLAVSGLPAGVTAVLGANPTSGTSSVTFSAGAGAAVGTSNINITGISGNTTATTVLPLTVHAPAFTLLNSGNVETAPGNSIGTYIAVGEKYGFSGNVTFSVVGLPSGVTASFNAGTAQYGSMLTLTAGPAATPGTTAITVAGQSGQLSSTTSFKLTVLAPTFELSTNNRVTLGLGTTTTTSVSVVPQYGFAGMVNLSVSGLPGGVNAMFSPASTTSGSSLMLTAWRGAQAGQYPITVTGTSGSQRVTKTFTLGLLVPTFTLYDNSSVVLSPGQTSQTSVLISGEYGFSGYVQLAVFGLPSGVKATFGTNPAQSSSTLSLTAGSTVPPGKYSVTIAGSSGATSASTTMVVTISGAAGMSPTAPRPMH